MRPIFEKLCETLSGDAMAKAAGEHEKAVADMFNYGSGFLQISNNGGAPEFKHLPVETVVLDKKPTTDADAELMARLLSGGVRNERVATD